MSVIVKGMQMPKSCFDCSWVEEQNENYYCPFKAEPIRVYKTKRENDCPLVEVPKHGRLIDADAFEKYCDQKWIPLNVDALHGAPTVIEAED